MDEMKTALHLQGLRFGYKVKRPVLDGLDLTVPDGQKIGLLGPNGCGKTTLFYLIMGLLKPQAGTIEIYGRTCEKETDFQWARQQAGLLFQDPNDQLFSPTVGEDVAFGPLNLGKTHHEAKQIVAKTLEQVGLSGYEERVTYQLSAGEKHLVALATVLSMKPRILLLDEPMTGLDEKATERVMAILRGLPIGYLMISHNRAILDAATTKILVMEEGKIRKT